jgi:hypothetical protein
MKEEVLPSMHCRLTTCTVRALVSYIFALALLLASVLRTPASAEECRGGAGAKAPAGTLAAPAAPCPPTARKLALPPPRDASKKPSTFQDGNTSIYFGGSLGTTIGGRR